MPEPEHTADPVCICKRHEVTGSPFSRLIWHEDCPQHGKKNNPWWPEHSDGDVCDGPLTGASE